MIAKAVIPADLNVWTNTPENTRNVTTINKTGLHIK